MGIGFHGKGLICLLWANRSLFLLFEALCLSAVMKTLAIKRNNELVINVRVPLDRNPAAVYLASLSESGRQTQRTALNTRAAMLTMVK